MIKIKMSVRFEEPLYRAIEKLAEEMTVRTGYRVSINDLTNTAVRDLLIKTGHIKEE